MITEHLNLRENGALIDYELKPRKLFKANMILCLAVLALIGYYLVGFEYRRTIMINGTLEIRSDYRKSILGLIYADFESNQKINRQDIQNFRFNLSEIKNSKTISVNGTQADISVVRQNRYHMILPVQTVEIPAGYRLSTGTYPVVIKFDSGGERLIKQLFTF